MIIGTAKRAKEGAKPLPTRHFSKKQEEAVAKATGGRRSKNSGNSGSSGASPKG